MKDYIIKKQWSDPIFVEDCDAPVECEEVEVCKKPSKECDKYMVAGFVDDRKRYKKCRKECKPHHEHHGHHHGSYQKGCGDFGGKTVLAPCMPKCKVIIDSVNSNCRSPPNGAPFRFRLPLPLAEYCDKDQGKHSYTGMIRTDIKFTAQIESDIVLTPEQGLWLIVDVIDDGPCKRKLLERRAVAVPVPVDGVAEPFEFEILSRKKCVDFRGHILFDSYFVIGGLTPPDLRSSLVKATGIIAPFSDYIEPIFEVTAFPTSGYTSHHGGHHGHHGGRCGKKYCKRC